MRGSARGGEREKGASGDRARTGTGIGVERAWIPGRPAREIRRPDV